MRSPPPLPTSRRTPGCMEASRGRRGARPAAGAVAMRIRGMCAARGMDLGRLEVEDVRQICNQRSYGRGRTYYRTGRVASVSLDGNRVSAEVRGTRTYQVWAEERKGGRLPYHCTCPYDWGGACKHVVAVLLHMVDHGAEMRRSAEESRAEIKSMLDESSPEYMRRFLAGEMEGDRSVAERFGGGMMWGVEAGADHRKKIAALFSRARSSARRGRGEGGGEPKVDLGPFAAVARRFERAGDYAEAARVHWQIADAAAAGAGKDGAYDDAIRESIAGAGLCTARIKKSTARDARARIRDMLGRYRAADARFRGDHMAALWAACAPGEGLRHLLSAVEPHVPKGGRAGGAGKRGPAKLKGGNLSRAKRLEVEMGRLMLAVKAAAMDGLGDAGAAEKMLAGHGAAGPETYTAYAGHLLREGQGGRALKVATDGIGRFGDSDDLADAALAAIGREDTAARCALLERLYLGSHGQARLDLLKKESDDWPAARSRLIAELEKDKRHPEHLLDLLVGEGMHKRALKALAGLGDAELLDRYREALGGRFPKSYLLAYQYSIEKAAAAARSGLACRRIALHLQCMAEVPAGGAGERAQGLAEMLCKRHSDKAELVDRINEIVW